MRITASLGVVGLFLGSVLGQTVHVVDRTGGGDFVSLQGAVSAASDGDTVLVRSTVAGDTVVVERALTIVGDDPDVTVDGSLTVRNVKGQVPFTLRNIAFEAGTAGASGIELFEVVAPVWMEGVSATGGPGGPGLSGGPGLLVDGCEELTIVDGAWIGGAGWSLEPGGGTVASSGGHGVLVSVARLVGLAAGTSAGGVGGDGRGTFGSGGGGGAGLVLESTERTLVAGWSSTGGDAGDRFDGADAPGLVLGSGALQFLDSVFETGNGAPLPGNAIETLPGAAPVVEEIADVARRITINAPLGELQAGDIFYEGEPGDKLLLMLGFAPWLQPVPSVVGWLSVVPNVVAEIGSTPTGTLAASLEVPAIANESLRFYLQVFVVGADGGYRLSAPTLGVIVDAAFAPGEGTR